MLYAAGCISHVVWRTSNVANCVLRVRRFLCSAIRTVIGFVQPLWARVHPWWLRCAIVGWLIGYVIDLSGTRPHPGVLRCIPACCAASRRAEFSGIVVGAPRPASSAALAAKVCGIFAVPAVVKYINVALAPGARTDRDPRHIRCARRCHICAGTGLPSPHLLRDWGSPLPHLHWNWRHGRLRCVGTACNQSQCRYGGG